MHIEMTRKASRGFEPRSLDSESRVLTVTPRGQVIYFVCLLMTGRRLEERGSESRAKAWRGAEARPLGDPHPRVAQPHTRTWVEGGSAGPGAKASRGFEPRSLDSESRVLTVTPRGQVKRFRSLKSLFGQSQKIAIGPLQQVMVDERSSKRVWNQGLARI